MEYSTALEVIGGCFLAYHLINLLRRSVTGLRAFVLPLLGIKKNLKSFGSWAGTHTKSEVRKSTMQELTIFSVKKMFHKMPLAIMTHFYCYFCMLYSKFISILRFKRWQIESADLRNSNHRVTKIL